MTLTLEGGPLDGVKIEAPVIPDKIVILDDHGRVTRYMTYATWDADNEPDGAGVASVIAGEEIAEFDSEFRRAMGANWEGAT